MKELSDKKKFKTYEKLMNMALDDANGVFEICMITIISMSVFNGHSEQEFDEILEHMKEVYKNTPKFDECVKAVFGMDL